MMKKTVIFSVLLVLVSFVLSACGSSLSGTYEYVSDGERSPSLGYIVFKSDTMRIVAGVMEYTGEYSIEDGKLTLYYSAMGLSSGALEYEFEKKGKSIFLNGSEFRKK